jgi:predicted GNAT family acetyltransferase
MSEKLNDLFSILEHDLAYSIYSLGILEKYHIDQFKLNYEINKYPNFGIIISEFTDRNFLLLSGTSQIINQMLENIQLPKKNQILSANKEHLELLKKKYTISNLNEQHRMLVSKQEFQLYQSPLIYQIKKLSYRDHKIIKNFYFNAGHKINFDPELIEEGAFFGAFHRNKLIACVCTHLISNKLKCAAIGNVLTKKEYRGLGLASNLTSLVTNDLLNRNCTYVALSVSTQNLQALRIYKKLGYEIKINNYEGELLNKNGGFIKKIFNRLISER